MRNVACFLGFVSILSNGDSFGFVDNGNGFRFQAFVYDDDSLFLLFFTWIRNFWVDSFVRRLNFWGLEIMKFNQFLI